MIEILDYKPGLESQIDLLHPINQGLIAYYNYSELVGNISIDKSPLENHGILENGPIYDYQGIRFDGTNDRILYGARPLYAIGSGDFSFVTKFRTSFKGNYGTVVNLYNSNNNEIILYTHQTSGVTRLWVGAQVANGTIDVADNKFHTVIFTRRNGSVNVYIDGKLNSSFTSTTSFPSPFYLTVGRRYADTAYPFNGTISGIAFYNRCLNVDEIIYLSQESSEVAIRKYFTLIPLGNRSISVISGIQSLESVPSNIYLSGPITFYPQSITSKELIYISKIIDLGSDRKNLTNKVIELNFDENLVTCSKKLNPPEINYIQYFGSSGNNTYYYKICAYNQDGETTSTFIKIESCQQLDSNNYVRINWKIENRVIGYKIFGRNENQYGLIANVTNTNYFDDNGSVNPTTTKIEINTTGYNPNKTNISHLFKIYTGINKTDNYLSARMQDQVYRPLDVLSRNGSIVSTIILITDYGDFYYYLGSYAWSGTGTRIGLFKIFKNDLYTLFIGNITINFNSNASFSDFRAQVYIHNSGTVNTNGLNVTGINTAWADERIAIGARIGFLASDFKKVQKWFTITAINSNTSITVNEPIPSYNNVPYIIEEIRIYGAPQPTVATSGLYVVKGLSFDAFYFNDITIPFATTVDNIRATYYLTNATTNTYVYGQVFLDYDVSPTQHFGWAITATGRPATTDFKIVKFNLRAPLVNLNAGSSSSAFVLETAWNRTVSNNAFTTLTIAKPKHGMFENEKIFMQLSQDYIINVIPDSSIYSNSTELVKSRFAWVPPGSRQQILWSNNSFSPTYSERLDCFITAANSSINFIKFNTTYKPGFKFQFFQTFKHNGHVSIPGKVPLHAVDHADLRNFYYEPVDGYFFMIVFNDSGNARVDRLLIVPLEADMSFAKDFDHQVILPKMNTPGAVKFNKLIFNKSLNLYDDFYGIRPESLRVFARTNGIDDNSGNWQRIDFFNDLSVIPSSNEIQFMLEFKIFQYHGISSRIHSINLLYETSEDLPENIQLNMNDTNINTFTIGFIQSGLFENLKTLEIHFYNKINNQLIFKDTSSSNKYGQFQYYNGSNWVNGIGSNMSNLRRRYVANNLPNVKIKVKIFHIL